MKSTTKEEVGQLTLSHFVFIYLASVVVVFFNLWLYVIYKLLNYGWGSNAECKPQKQAVLMNKPVVCVGSGLWQPIVCVGSSLWLVYRLLRTFISFNESVG